MIMKRLFIYFSDTGNGDLVASYLEDKGVDIRKVIPKKKLPKSFFFKILTGGFLAGLKKKSKLVDFDSNIEGYDEVIIGSPIWNARFSSPINKVLSLLGKDERLSFLLYSGSGEAKKALKRIEKEYGKRKVIILKEPKKYQEALEKLESFLK